MRGVLRDHRRRVAGRMRVVVGAGGDAVQLLLVGCRQQTVGCLRSNGRRGLAGPCRFLCISHEAMRGVLRDHRRRMTGRVGVGIRPGRDAVEFGFVSRRHESHRRLRGRRGRSFGVPCRFIGRRHEQVCLVRCDHRRRMTRRVRVVVGAGGDAVQLLLVGRRQQTVGCLRSNRRRGLAGPCRFLCISHEAMRGVLRNHRRRVAGRMRVVVGAGGNTSEFLLLCGCEIFRRKTFACHLIDFLVDGGGKIQ